MPNANPNVAFRPLPADLENIGSIITGLRQQGITANRSDAIRFALTRIAATFSPDRVETQAI